MILNDLSSFLVEELMEAKRIMQELEDDVVKKFSALNKQYEQINGKFISIINYTTDFSLF